MNTVIIMGNMTRDIELRYTPKGTCVGQFGLAWNNKWKDDAGAVHEQAHFFDVTAWGRTAEVVAQYFKKGKPILVTGELRQESWDDKQSGQKRHKVKINMTKFDFCGGDKVDNGQRSGAQADAPGGGAEAPQQDAAPSSDDSDVPF